MRRSLSARYIPALAFALTLAGVGAAADAVPFTYTLTQRRLTVDALTPGGVPDSVFLSSGAPGTFDQSVAASSDDGTDSASASASLFHEITPFSLGGMAHGDAMRTAGGFARGTAEANIGFTLSAPTGFTFSVTTVENGDLGNLGVFYFLFHVNGSFQLSGGVVNGNTTTYSGVLPDGIYEFTVALDVQPDMAGSGDASFSYLMTLVPEPSVGLLLATAALACRRRRRAIPV